MGKFEDLVVLVSNLVKNTAGTKRDLMTLIEQRDISMARSLFEDHRKVIDAALKEYHPSDHDVMNRPNKSRDGKSDYETEKLPRNWQDYINEVALFFLLGNPIVWKADTKDSEAFDAFKKVLLNIRFDSFMRQGKRLAGSETQCAKLYRVFNDDDGNPDVEIVMLSRSGQWDVRPLFDKWGHLIAAGYGYYTKEGGITVEHFDIETAQMIFRCERGSLGVWNVTPQTNPTGKINMIICRQRVEWEPVRERIARDERTDCKTADSNNYFSDPIAVASSDVVDSIFDPETTGKLIKVSEGSKFDYVNPPSAPELMRMEKENIRKSILQDSFTPDFDFSAMVGLGTLSGEAIKRALILGYIKRARNIEIYHPLVDREKNLILAIMERVTHIEMKGKIEQLRESLSFEFAEPFGDDLSTKIANLSQAVSAGILSVEEAVSRLSFTDNQEEEIARLMSASKKI